MLKLDADSKDTLFRLSFLEKAKSIFPNMKHQEVYFKLMTIDLNELLALANSQKKNQPNLRLIVSTQPDL